MDNEDQMGGGFGQSCAVFDTQGGLLDWDSGFAREFASVQDGLVPGTTFHQLLRDAHRADGADRGPPESNAVVWPLGLQRERRYWYRATADRVVCVCERRTVARFILRIARESAAAAAAPPVSPSSNGAASSAESDHERSLRSAALQTSSAILALQRRAERELVEAQRALQERTEELARSLALSRATLEATTDGILAADADGQITATNEAFARLLGPELTAADTTGAARTWPEVLDAIRARLREGHPDDPILDRQTPDTGSDACGLLELADGRFLECYSRPQRVEDRRVGQVWVFREVTARKRAEAELAHAHQQLLTASRQAGMAEVATSVLHNVGNVLNSVNVSAGLLADSLRASRLPNLGRAVALLRENLGRLPEYLGNDPRGKLLPDYLAQLADHLIAAREADLAELAALQQSIDHIKQVVAAQQGLAKASGAREMVRLADLFEDSLRLNAEALRQYSVEAVRDYGATPASGPPLAACLDRHKVLQILVNLVANAAFACREHGRAGGGRVFLAASAQAGRARFVVADNGVGIAAEDMTRIFRHGFTTRPGGHGFGLHGGALAAAELGGSLSVASDGPGKGATFTLDLPLGLPHHHHHDHHQQAPSCPGERAS